MAKNYTLTKSGTTGWWIWACKDGSNSGSSTSKKEAKEQGKANCTSGIIIIPPKFDATYDNGSLSSFAAANLDEVKTTFSAGEINEDLFDFFFGLNCPTFSDLDETDRCVAVFKIWGVYLKGGVNKPEILLLYNLTEPQFQKIINKDYIDVQITIDDNLNYTWVFPI